MPFSATVPCRWPDATVVCIASGPSLSDADVDFVGAVEVPTIVVNNAWHAAPWADVLYAADRDWWMWQAQAGIDDSQLPPTLYGMDVLALPYRPTLRLLKLGAASGLCTSPDSLASGGHSGYQAINLAAHLIGFHGRIILLGYDMQPSASGAHHFHADHPNGRHVNYEAKLPHYVNLAAALQHHPALELVNASRETAITCLPRAPIEHLL